MTESKFMLVRIKPANKKSVHSSLGYTIRKIDAWCKIPYAIALELKKERMNELNPLASPPIFDVLEPEEAREIVAVETAKEEPAGTIDNPKEKQQSPDEPEPARRSRAPRA